MDIDEIIEKHLKTLEQEFRERELSSDKLSIQDYSFQ